MNLIPKIRPGEEISIDKLNALIDKVNSIEISKRELENIRNEIRTDVEKYNSVFENIKASQGVVQQLSKSDSLETITNLLQQFVSTNASTTTTTTQKWGMADVENGGIEIYLEENGEKTASFTLSQGINGEIGPQGPQGPRGYPGPRGEIGPRGFRGITGKQGDGASIHADYVNYVENTSLLPSDLQQYLRIQIKKIDSEGVETTTDTCYIPTQGYIYVPEIYTRGDPENKVSYVRFKKVVNTYSTASALLDDNWKITGPRGATGADGARGMPGSGLTFSNLVRLTDSHIFARKPVGTEETLEELLNSKNKAEQDALIAELMSDITTENIFGLIPLDSDSVTNANKFTFVENPLPFVV